MPDQLHPSPRHEAAHKPESPAVTALKWLLRIALPLLIIAVALLIGSKILWADKPAEREPPPRPRPLVETMPAERVDYTVVVTSQGTIEAGTTGTLQTEVPGKIVTVSSSFRDGGFFCTRRGAAAN